MRTRIIKKEEDDIEIGKKWDWDNLKEQDEIEISKK